MKLGTVLLAAGASRRFGEADKLTAPYQNRPLVCFALDALKAVPAERRIAVVRGEQVGRLARQSGFETVVNAETDRGLSHSIALGVSAMRGMDAVLLMAADMPCVTPASLMRLTDALKRPDIAAACLTDGDVWGNPAAFAAECFPALLTLTGDRGAKSVLKALGERTAKVLCTKGELRDADTRQALEELESGE